MSNQNEQPQGGMIALDGARQTFAVALQDAQRLDIVNNVAGAFDAAIIVSKLEQVLTPEIMASVFMPLMNKKIGFRTDRDPSKPDRNGQVPRPYSVDVVRTCIIDAAANGLLPTGNQFNIIAGTMYPTKEGYTALLTKLKTTMGLQYMFEFDPEANAKSSDPTYVAIPCRISYKTSREDVKGWFKYVAMVKSNGATSTTDQLRGKAERKCKKAFFEFLTGIDLGEADASETVDVAYTEVKSEASLQQQSAAAKAREVMERARAKREAEQQAQAAMQQGQQPMAGSQPSINFDQMSDAEIDEYVSVNMGGVEQ